MQIGVIATDYGPHPADKLATATVERITDLIQIDHNSGSDAAIEARRALPRFKLALLQSMEGHHATLQRGERGRLVAPDSDPQHPLEPSTDHMDTAMASVIEAAKGTPFEAWMGQAETQRVIRDKIVGVHFRTSLHDERSWHADRHPDSAHAKAFRQRQAGA